MTRTPASSPRHEATPLVTELELESAILRGVANRRPVGRHKHFLMIGLQADVHDETGVWVPINSIWDQLRKMYDLEALDGMSSSTPSLPASPETLSPIPHPRRRRPRAGSASSLSSIASASSPGPSKSAQVIDSEFFDDVFWLPGTVPPDKRRRSPPTLSGAFEMDTPVDTDEEGFHDEVYKRAEGDEEDNEWEAGVQAQLARNESKGGKKGRKPASGSSGRRTSGGEPDTSPLSSDAEQPTQKRRGRVSKGTGKRQRESVETDEEERPANRRRRR